MQRVESTYENRSSKFYRSDQDFQRQYFHIYESRLKQLADLLKHKITEKYGKYFDALMLIAQFLSDYCNSRR